MLLQHFWLGLSKEPALQLDISAGGSFTHKITAEGEALLDRILENTSFTETLRQRNPQAMRKFCWLILRPHHLLT